MSTITDFLIDISDNMSKKLPIAQKAIKDQIIPLLNFSEPIGMRTFLSIVKSPIVINSIDLGITNKHDFTEKIDKLPIPNGGSPIGYTMQKSLEAMKDKKADKKRIILVTAGTETDGGTYDFEVEKAKKNDNVQVNIIGLGLSGFEEKTAQKVADMSNGVFCNLDLSKGNDDFAIKNTLQPLIDILNGIEPATAIKEEPKKEEPKVEPKEDEPKVEPIKVEPKIEPIKAEPKEEAKPIVNEIKEDIREEKVEPIIKEDKQEALYEAPSPKGVIESKNDYKPSPIYEEPKQQPKANIVFEDKNPIDSKIFVAGSNASEETKLDTIKEIEAKNFEISNILNENMKTIQGFLMKERETKAEIEKLRNAGKESISKIEELKGFNKKAQEEIDRLEAQIGEMSIKIKEFKAAQTEDKEAIRRLKQIDEEVILFEDKEKIHSNSKKSEEYTFSLLQKKYPERVVWINKEKKQELGCDFKIMFDKENIEYFIVCKGVPNSSKTFFLTKHEWELCLKNNRNYQVYIINDLNENPKVTIIDNLMGWILNGRVRPYASKNQKVKADRVMFTLIA